MPTFLLASTTKPVPPTVRSEEKRLVLEAVVENRLVVVAEVEVELMAVKFWKVEEAVVWRAPVESMRKSSVPAAFLSWKKLPAKPVVLEATIKLPVVVVAKRPRRALEFRREEAPTESEVVRPLGKMKSESEEEANLELAPPPLASVPQ